MYIEASYPRKPGEIAKLEVTVPNNGSLSCLSFYYHMYGASAGTLNVYSGNIKVFTATGDQGDNWLMMEANLYLNGVVSKILSFYGYIKPNGHIKRPDYKRTYQIILQKHVIIIIIIISISSDSNWTERSTIQGVIARAISKSDEREARGRFEITSTTTP